MESSDERTERRELFSAEAFEQIPGQMAMDTDEPALILPDGTRYSGRLQHDDDGRPIVRMARCGECGFEWNDALITSITPTPSGRCPNEYGHRS